MKTATVEAPLIIEIRLELGVGLTRGLELVEELQAYIENTNATLNEDELIDVISIQALHHHCGTDLVVTTRNLGPGEDTELADALKEYLEDGGLAFEGGEEVFGMTTRNLPSLHLVK